MAIWVGCDDVVLLALEKLRQAATWAHHSQPLDSQVAEEFFRTLDQAKLAANRFKGRGRLLSAREFGLNPMALTRRAKALQKIALVSRHNTPFFDPKMFEGTRLWKDGKSTHGHTGKHRPKRWKNRK